MMKKKNWLDEKGRKAQLDEEIQSTRTAYFGFSTVPEKEKIKRVIRHFDAVARRYDLMNTLLSFGIHYAWKRKAIRMMGLEPGSRVLDVCGGTGDLSLFALNQIGKNGRVYIYDINRPMMQAGLPKIARASALEQIRLVQGDAEAISALDNGFDAAMVGFGIRNVTYMKQAFSEMYRVLKPGGRLMCLEFSKPTNPVFRFLYDLYSFYAMPFLGQAIVGNRQAYLHLTESIRLFPTPEELSQQLSMIGFKDVRFSRLTNGIAVIHLAEK